jgi:hypothetical protein
MMSKETTKRPRGRPKATEKPIGRTLVELALRDLLEQLDADSPPFDSEFESAAAAIEIKTLKAPLILRMIQSGSAVVISRAMLRRLIAELSDKIRNYDPT